MLENLMDSYAAAIRPAIGQDSAEGTTQDFALPTDVPPGNAKLLWQNRPCGYQEASGGMVFKYHQRNIVVSNTLYFNQDPGDLANCLVKVTRPMTGDVVFLDVKGSQDPVQIGADWVWPVVCDRWRQPT